MNIKNFYRYNSALIKNMSVMIETNSFQADFDVMATLQIGDGLLLADWDDTLKQGEVKYIGVISGGLDSNTQTLPVVWFEKQFLLSPNPGGYQFWEKDFFKFAKAPAERYGLKQQFDNVGLLSHQNLKGSANSQETSGYIYVIKSKYGYKIGKTKSLKNRAQLFSVKMPFDFNFIFTFFSQNYSKLESDLHRLMQEKRLNGEWFSLNEKDIKSIETFCANY